MIRKAKFEEIPALMQIFSNAKGIMYLENTALTDAASYI